jgi:ABC-2 type transport system permease protein
MARLGPRGIPASAQFGAVAWLRWRLFANGFRRKGGTGELVARIIVFPVALLFIVGPTVGAVTAAYFATSRHNLEYLTGIFWGIFVLQILISVNISAPGLSFSPESLIRYPVNFPRYLTIRLFLGLLSASTLVGTFSLLGAATGISGANPALAVVAYPAAIALAICNMLFVRMIFAWIDRWLSTRRAREILTVGVFAISIGIQYVNVTVNGVGKHLSHAQRQARVDSFLHIYKAVEPYLRPLPPGLAGSAIISTSQGATFYPFVLIAGILAIASIFLAVFGFRMLREYRGEDLSETGQRQPEKPREHNLNRIPVVPSVTKQTSSTSNSILSPLLAGLLEKEWIYVRRNPAQFYGLIAPLAMVFIFAGRLGSFARTGYVFPAAVAYSVLGIAALAYNILGLDASGIQAYFLAPISMRSVILAKNLFNFGVTIIQLLLAFAVVSISYEPPRPLVAISTVLWVALASLINATIGNMRSIIAPKKIDPSKISRKQASQLSALMCIGIMLAVGALGAGIMVLGQYLDMRWLPIPILATLAFGAFILYMAGLNSMDRLALNHRESLIEELSKAS